MYTDEKEDNNLNAKGDGAPRRGRVSKLKRLKSRIRLLKNYRDDSLAHRASDIELAVETLIFEQLMQQADVKNALIDHDAESRLHQTLTDVQQNLTKLLHHSSSATSTARSQDHEQVAAQLAALRVEHDSLIEFVSHFEAATKADAAFPAAINVDEFNSLGEYEVLTRQVDQLTAELAIATHQYSDTEPTTDSFALQHAQEHIAILQKQLLQERQTVVELRLEVEDQSAQIANLISPNKTEAIQLPWEKLKEQLLARLECDAASHDQNASKATQIEQIIAQTQSEIDRRDREIAELRRLLTEQSTSSNSVAIGAAAVAQLFDHDDLIREERANLQKLQSQLQQKLREAEVENSIQRAKLARRETELEEQYKDAAQHTQQELAAEDKKTHGSRWLARLGLGEDKS